MRSSSAVEPLGDLVEPRRDARRLLGHLLERLAERPSFALRVVSAVSIALIALRSSRAVAISSLELVGLLLDELALAAVMLLKASSMASPLRRRDAGRSVPVDAAV